MILNTHDKPLQSWRAHYAQSFYPLALLNVPCIVAALIHSWIWWAANALSLYAVYQHAQQHSDAWGQMARHTAHVWMVMPFCTFFAAWGCLMMANHHGPFFWGCIAPVMSVYLVALWPAFRRKTKESERPYYRAVFSVLAAAQLAMAAFEIVEGLA